MQLIKPRLSFVIISLLSLVLAISVFVLPINTTAVIALIVLSAINILSSSNYIRNFINKDNEFNLRLSFLITFVCSILISFSPYLFRFTTSSSSFVTTSVFSFVFLIILFLTQTDKKQAK